ncbi:MAG: DUF6048 family protein [Bacteroidetes bacterium]|nr:DUF6048 family protein [Bacteroidota bacterium]MDA1120700.1 DUF6048 family protein [Bacteroidota bacterium]
MFKYFASLLCIAILTASQGVAQKYVPHTFIGGIEFPSIFRSLISDERNMGEIQAGINIASHMVIFEYGFENVKHENSSYLLRTKGPFFRTGLDLTLNPKNENGNIIFMGFRIARANYKNSVDFVTQSTAFNDPEVSAKNDNLIANWKEWTFGMKAKLTERIMIGYTMRYKLGPKIKGGDSLRSFDLPGYGRAKKKNNFGLSYYIYYRLNFRKLEAPQVPISP